MQILGSDRFKKEYEQVKKFIDETKNETVKTELKSLLGELVFNIKKLDSMHRDIVNIRRLPDDSQDLRNKIIEIRKKINKKINL